MKDELISMFLDDELSLDDKLEFVEMLGRDQIFKDETIQLLQQEKLIRSEVVDQVPSLEFKRRKKPIFPLLRPMGMVASALALAVFILLFFMPTQDSPTIPYRFVIYRPEVSKVEITGSFNEWKKFPLKKIGNSGYWEITLNLSRGDHRFTYILEGNQRVPDPTIPFQEQDDFGGENSVLFVEAKT